MRSRTWAFTGALLAGGALAALLAPAPAEAAGANLIAKLNGRVYKARRATIEGTYAPLTGELVLGSSDVRVHRRTLAVTVKLMTIACIQEGIEGATPKTPVTIDSPSVVYAAGRNLAPGSGVGEAAGWLGSAPDVQLTIRSYRVLPKRDRDGNLRARISGTFGGTLTASDGATVPQTLTMTKGHFQAAVVVAEASDQ